MRTSSKSVTDLGRLAVKIEGPHSKRLLDAESQFVIRMLGSKSRSPLRELVEIDDVGAAAAFLASPQARCMTGTVLHVDAVPNIMG